MKIAIYRYDADGCDEKLSPEDLENIRLDDKQLLWITILERKSETIERIAELLKIENVPIESLLNISERPKIDKFKDFYRFFIVSVESKNEKISRVPIDFLVGKNFIITIHDGEVNYFKEFRNLEKGETQIGELDAESFVATLLDLHIVSYFNVIEKIEEKVDKLDDKVLTTDLEDRDFLSEMVNLRGDVSKLRRWFVPHRNVFYALSRPDFHQIAHTETDEKSFKLLNEHFENAIDAIETSRETVLSVFDLYATKSAQKMNVFIQRLTFLTLMVGSLSVIAGVLGMNYESEIFKHRLGFWATIAGMTTFVIGLTVLAKFKRWI